MPEVSGVTRLNFQSGETIFDEGADPEAAYMIASGKVEIRLGVRGSNPRTLATLGRGQVFGELALFDGYVHMASAVAVQPTTVSAIERAQFEALVDGMDPVLRGVVLQMVSRARQMAKTLKDTKREAIWATWNAG